MTKKSEAVAAIEQINQMVDKYAQNVVGGLTSGAIGGGTYATGTHAAQQARDAAMDAAKQQFKDNPNKYAEKKKTAADLLKINVNSHIEKKNNLSYLSWAWAWSKVLEMDPQANFNVRTFPNGNGNYSPLMDLGGSYMVWVEVIIFGKEVTAFLPVLDYRNKPISNPSSFDVNTSIMRCLTKGIALHGLGLYIYAGEDLPMDEKEEEVPIIKDGKIYRDQPDEWDNSDASRTLFAETLIKMIPTNKTVAGLQSYWLNNQLQLESLKKTHPELFTEVLDCFKKAKSEMEIQPKE